MRLTNCSYSLWRVLMVVFDPLLRGGIHNRRTRDAVLWWRWEKMP